MKSQLEIDLTRRDEILRKQRAIQFDAKHCDAEHVPAYLGT